MDFFPKRIRFAACLFAKLEYLSQSLKWWNTFTMHSRLSDEKLFGWVTSIHFSKYIICLISLIQNFDTKSHISIDDFLALNETFFIKVLKNDTALCIFMRVCMCDDSIHYVPLTNISSYVPNVVLVIWCRLDRKSYEVHL